MPSVNSVAKTPFDFDTPIDRRGTASIKWDKYKGRDVIPLWVADMDFACAPAVVEALHRRVDHPIYGYSDPPAELAGTVVAHLEREYRWKIEPDWIVWLPGLVVGLNVVCRAFGEPGDDVLTATPVYHPFLSAPREFGAQRDSRAHVGRKRGLALGHRGARTCHHAEVAPAAALQSAQPRGPRILARRIAGDCRTCANAMTSRSVLTKSTVA